MSNNSPEAKPQSLEGTEVAAAIVRTDLREEGVAPPGTYEEFAGMHDALVKLTRWPDYLRNKDNEHSIYGWRGDPLVSLAMDPTNDQTPPDVDLTVITPVGSARRVIHCVRIDPIRNYTMNVGSPGEPNLPFAEIIGIARRVITRHIGYLSATPQPA